MIRIIGVDPGVKTGVAIATLYENGGKIFQLETYPLLSALNKVLSENPAFVVLEDARLRKWFGKSGTERLQGAGSIKRDCQIWQDFLDEKAIHYILVPPKKNKTKMSADEFTFCTGVVYRTNQHERDAAALLLPYNYKIALATYEAKKNK